MRPASKESPTVNLGPIDDVRGVSATSGGPSDGRRREKSEPPDRQQ